MSEIADGSIDTVMCDLPYGTTQNAWDSVLPLDRLWAHYWRVCRGAVVALMEYMIRTYTNPDALVLDNCMGSGTMGVAAMNCGRRFVGIERDPNYFAIAERRIKESPGFQILHGGG